MVFRKKRKPKIYTDKKGYKRFSGSKKLVHRAVAKKKVGGRIFPGRVVHHKDGDKSNFRKSNLQIMTRSEHSRLHARKKRKRFKLW
jgi:hypothetical protein